MTRRSRELTAEQRSCVSWPRFGPHVENEVQARQVLNAEHASRAAASIGLTWLVHVDVDELFYVSSPDAFAAHFAAMDKRGVDHVTYANHEGVPEADDDALPDYFCETTLFRVHHLTIAMTPDAQKCMQWWQARTRHGQYLLCYDNGKAAVRLNGGAVSPTSVHGWSCAAKPLVKRTALADARHLDVGNVLPLAEPCILHYVACGRGWLGSKYEILGDFPDAWFGGALPIAPSFHLDARDAACGEGDALGEMYTSHVAAPNAATVAAHVLAGVCRRYVTPQEVLGAGRARPPDVAPADVAPAAVAPAAVAAKERFAPAAATPARPGPAGKEDYTYEKAWILAAAANRFL